MNWEFRGKALEDAVFCGEYIAKKDSWVYGFLIGRYDPCQKK